MPEVYSYLREDFSGDIGFQREEIDKYCKENGITIDHEMVIKMVIKYREIDAQLKWLYDLGQDTTLIMYSLCRFGRKERQVFNILSHLIKNGVKIISIKEDLILEGDSVECILFHKLSDSVLSRKSLDIRAGIATAKRKGRRVGRKRKAYIKSKLDKYTAHIIRWYCDKGWSQARIVEKLCKTRTKDGGFVGCTGATLHKFLKRSDIVELIKLANERLEEKENEFITDI